MYRWCIKFGRIFNMTEQQSQTPPPLKVILASKSPRRRDLLKEAGIKFTVRTPIEPVDETLDADELMMPVEEIGRAHV